MFGCMIDLCCNEWPVPVVCGVSDCGADGESKVVIIGRMICVAANDLSLSCVVCLNAGQMVRVKL